MDTGDYNTLRTLLITGPPVLAARGGSYNSGADQTFAEACMNHYHAAIDSMANAIVVWTMCKAFKQHQASTDTRVTIHLSHQVLCWLLQMGIVHSAWGRLHETVKP